MDVTARNINVWFSFTSAARGDLKPVPIFGVEIFFDNRDVVGIAKYYSAKGMPSLL